LPINPPNRFTDTQGSPIVFSYLFIFFHSVFFSSRDFSFSLEIGGGGIVGRTWQEFSVSSFLSCANQT
jgi:hypothetical protein